MNTYVLDTNVFFNMEAGLGLGKTTNEILTNLIKVCSPSAKFKEGFLMPPSIVAEMETFFENQSDELFKIFMGYVTVKSPNLEALDVSARVVGELIDDYRNRAFRGMKVAEEELIKGAESFMGKEVLPRQEFQKTVGKIISNMRLRYRNATRTGTIDSVADFDLIMLACESGAHLVSSDEGVIAWARKIGVKEMAPHVFGKKMQAYL